MMTKTNNAFILAMAAIAIVAISCDDKDSKSQSVNICKPECYGTMALVCNADGSSELVSCKFGCEDGGCLGDPDDPNGCKRSCRDSIATICNAEGLAEQRQCPYGCDGNACALQPLDSPLTGPCAGVSCKNGGKCDRGICVSQKMASVKEGDECDRWFQGYCDGNFAVKCDNISSYPHSMGKISITDCTDLNGCAMGIFEDYVGTSLLPTCRGDGASCTKVGDGRCVIENNDEGQPVAREHRYHWCVENTDGSMSGGSYFDDDAYPLYTYICENGCNPQMTGCLNTYTCQGDILHSGYASLSPTNCANREQICVMVEQDGFCADPCERKGEISHHCDKSRPEIERRRECFADDNGRLYYEETAAFFCDHGCDESTDRCKKLVSDEYTTCDWNTFTQRCDGNIRVGCVEGIVRAEMCIEALEYCDVEQNAATCVYCEHGIDEATGKCKKLVNDEYSNCNPSTFKQRCDANVRVTCEDGIVRTIECNDKVRDPLGHQYMIGDCRQDQDEASCVLCYNGNDEVDKTCVKPVDNKFTDCDPDTFKERCESNARITCDYGYEYADYCMAGERCTIIDGSASCQKSCPGEQYHECDGDNLVTHICKENENGIWFPELFYSTPCIGTCDEQKNECVCNISGYWCDKNKLAHCDSETQKPVYEDCGSKYCVEPWGNVARCYDRKFSSYSDCTSYHEYGEWCAGKTYNSYDCDYSNDSSDAVYGKKIEIYCENGCSKYDGGCCDDGYHYDFSDERCVHD